MVIKEDYQQPSDYNQIEYSSNLSELMNKVNNPSKTMKQLLTEASPVKITKKEPFQIQKLNTFLSRGSLPLQSMKQSDTFQSIARNTKQEIIDLHLKTKRKILLSNMVNRSHSELNLKLKL